jgi:hypothetical protein
LDLRKVTIIQATNYIIVNLSSQLQPNHSKTVYLDDNSFISLCVKDMEISTIDNMTAGCSGENETDFTSCLGNNLGLVLNGVTCTDLGTTIKIDNLQHSAVRGTQASSNNNNGSGGGGCTSNWVCTAWNKCVNGTQNRTCSDTRCHRTYGKPAEIQNCTCQENWICSSWSECTIDGKQTRTCNDYNNCKTTKLKPVTNQSCKSPESTKNSSESNINDKIAQQNSNILLPTDVKEQEKNDEDNNQTKQVYVYAVPIIAVILVIVGIIVWKQRKHKK